MANAYRKVNDDFDVLGQPSNPKRYYLPEGAIPIIEIDNKKFFFNQSRSEVQCTMCLNIVILLADKKENAVNGVRRLYIQGNCLCDSIDNRV